MLSGKHRMSFVYKWAPILTWTKYLYINRLWALLFYEAIEP